MVFICAQEKGASVEKGRAGRQGGGGGATRPTCMLMSDSS
jgi:hypothetical protein